MSGFVSLHGLTIPLISFTNIPLVKQDHAVRKAIVDGEQPDVNRLGLTSKLCQLVFSTGGSKPPHGMCPQLQALSLWECKI